MFLNEVLRRHVVISRIIRIATNDFEFEKKPQNVKKKNKTKNEIFSMYFFATFGKKHVFYCKK